MIGISMKRQRQDKRDIYRSQQGMASITVTLIIMIVISLIVLGFAALSRREQRLSLDQQLSAQAFYAAESAVNDAIKVIQDTLATQPTTDVKKSTCDNTGPYAGLEPKLTSDGTVGYTCLLVDSAPAGVKYDDVGEQPVVIPLRSAQPINSIEISWTPGAGASSGTLAACANAVSNTSFVPAGSWGCMHGLLQVDVVNTEGGALSSAALSNSLSSIYAVPSLTNTPLGGGNSNFTSGKGAQYSLAACTASQCRITIDGVDTASLGLRISSIYKLSNLTIQGRRAGVPVGFIGSQVVIDATGKAQDVLRRIQVRVPTGARAANAPSGLQTNTSICKRFAFSANFFEIPDSIVDPIDTSNTMCVPGGGGVAIPGAPGAQIGDGRPSTSPYIVQPGHRYNNVVGFTNTTSVPAGVSVTSCVWHFGNGQTSTSSCNPGEELFYNFSLPGDTSAVAVVPSCDNNTLNSPIGTVNTCTPQGTTVPFPDGCRDYPRRTEVRRRYTVWIEAQFSNGTRAVSPPIYVGLPGCG